MSYTQPPTSPFSLYAPAFSHGYPAPHAQPYHGGRRHSLPTGDDVDWDSFPSTSPVSSRRPSGDVSDSLYHYPQSRKRSLDPTMDHGAPPRKNSHPGSFERFEDSWQPRRGGPPSPHQPSSPYLRPSSKKTANSSRRGSGSGSHTSGSSGRGTSAAPPSRMMASKFEGQEGLESYSFPPAAPKPNSRSDRQRGFPMDRDVDGRDPYGGRSLSPASRTPSPIEHPFNRLNVSLAIPENCSTGVRGRRIDMPGSTKYPHSISREKLNEARSNGNLRTLPALSGKDTYYRGRSSPLNRPPADLPQPGGPLFPEQAAPGRWTVPRRQSADATINAPPKTKKIIEMERSVRVRQLMMSASGRRTLQKEGIQFATQELDTFLGPVNPHQVKAQRGGYAGLGIAKDDKWHHVPEFEELINEKNVPADAPRGARARSSSAYLDESDEDPTTTSTPATSSPRSTTRGQGLTNKKSSSSRDALRNSPPSPNRSRSAPLNPQSTSTHPYASTNFSNTTQVGGPGFFHRGGSEPHGTAGPRPPPLDLGRVTAFNSTDGEGVIPKSRRAMKQLDDTASTSSHPPHPMQGTMDERAQAKLGKRRGR